MRQLRYIIIGYLFACFKSIWAAFCNVMYGYVPTVQVIDEGGYETRGLEDGEVGQFAPEAESLLIERVAALTERARGKVANASEDRLEPAEPRREAP